MSDVSFRVALRVTKSPAKVHERFATAIARGLNEGGDKVRTQFQRGLWRQTGVKQYKSITSRVSTIRAHAGGLAYQIVGHGKGMPIREFTVASAAGHVLATPWRTPHLFARSFFIRGNMSAPRARLGPLHSSPVRSLYGPSIPKEMMKGAMPALFLFAAAEFVPPAIMKHLAKAVG